MTPHLTCHAQLLREFLTVHTHAAHDEHMTKLVFAACCRPSDYGLGVSDEQTDQVELLRPPSAADFQGLPDAPTLHRLRQVSGLHVTDDTDPARISTNTGRSAALVA